MPSSDVRILKKDAGGEIYFEKASGAGVEYDPIIPYVALDGAVQTIPPWVKTENIVWGCSAKVEDTNAADVIAASPGTGLRYYITDMMVTNSDATVGTLVTIRDSAGVALWSGYAAALGGGWARTFATPIPATVEAHIQVICGTTSSETYACVAGFKAA